MTLPPEAACIRPKHSLVLIRLDERVDMTAGGIHIPDTAQRQPPTATVMAIGEGGRMCPRRRDDGTVDRSSYHWVASEVRLGDVVNVGAFNGTRVDQHFEIRDGHEWWLVETLPEVKMDWNRNHPGDVYLIQRREGEK